MRRERSSARFMALSFRHCLIYSVQGGLSRDELNASSGIVIANDANTNPQTLVKNPLSQLNFSFSPVSRIIMRCSCALLGPFKALSPILTAKRCNRLPPLRLLAFALGFGDVALELSSRNSLHEQLVQLLVGASSGFGLVEPKINAAED